MWIPGWGHELAQEFVGDALSMLQSSEAKELQPSIIHGDIPVVYCGASWARRCERERKRENACLSVCLGSGRGWGGHEQFVSGDYRDSRSYISQISGMKGMVDKCSVGNVLCVGNHCPQFEEGEGRSVDVVRVDVRTRVGSWAWADL